MSQINDPNQIQQLKPQKQPKQLEPLQIPQPTAASWGYSQLQSQESRGDPAQELDHSLLVSYRAAGLKDEFWQSNPMLAASLITSNLPEADIKTIASHWNKIVNWTDSFTNYAGVPGALSQAYVKALTVYDQTSSRTALDTLNELKNLTPEEQNALTALIRSGPATTAGLTGTQHLIGTQQQVGVPPGLAQALGVVPETLTANAETGGVNIGGTPSEDVLNRVTQLEAMFPQLRGKLNFDNSAITLDDIVQSFDAAGSELRTHPGDSLKQDVVNTVQGVFGVFGAIINPIARVAGTGEANVEAALTRSNLPGAQVASNVLSAGITHVAAPYSRVVNEVLQDTVGALGTWFTTAWWKNLFTHPLQTIEGKNEALVGSNVLTGKPSDVGAETQNLAWINATGGIVLAFLLHETSEVAGAYGLTTKLPYELLPGDPPAGSFMQALIHPIRTYVDPSVRAAIFDSFGKTVQEYLEKNGESISGDGPVGFAFRSPPAQQFFDKIASIADDPAIENKLGAVYRNGLGYGNSTTILDTLLKTPRDDMPRVWFEKTTSGSPEEIAAAMDRIAQAEQTRKDFTAEEAAASTIRAANEELISAKAAAAQLIFRDPEQVFFPGANYNTLTSFMHRSLEGNPTGFAENLMYRVLAPGRTIKDWTYELFNLDRGRITQSPWLTNVTDKLESHPFLYNPAHEGFSSVHADINATIIERVGRELGMRQEDIDAVIQNFVTKTDDPNAVFRAMNDYGKRRAKYVRPDTNDWAKQQLSQGFEHDFNDGRNNRLDVTDPVTGLKTTEPVHRGEIVDGKYRAKAFLDTELLGREKLYLPDLRIIKDTTSWIKRWEKTDFIPKRIIGQGIGALQAGLQIAGRTTMLPLWAAFKLPALILKHAVDPVLGNLALPGMTTGGVPSNILVTEFDALAHPKADVLGSVNEGFRGPAIKNEITLPTQNYIDNGALSVEGAMGLLNRIQEMNASVVVRGLLNRDLNVDKTIAAMTGGDVALSRYYEILKRSWPKMEDTAALRVELERQVEAIKQASLGQPDMIDFMKTGKIRLPKNVPADVEQSISFIRDRLSELDKQKDSPAIRALQGELQAQYETLYQNPPDGFDIAHIEDERAMVKELQDRYANNELQMPQEIRVTRLARSAYRDANGNLQLDHGSWLELARETNAKLSQLTYRVFQPVGWADRTLGRTNYFVNQGYTWYNRYRAAGMSDADAEAHATLAASLDTKNMFYDLTTRSPAERGLRNTFWFAPATGELMYRWFYSIPAAQGNALLGNMINLLKLENYVNLFKSLGVVRTTNQGKDYVAADWAKPFLETISSGKWQYTPQEYLGIPLTSLDPLLTTPLPTLGPIQAKAITELAQHVPALQGLANIFAPYGSSSTFFPYTGRRIAGAFGINVSDFMSNSAIQETWNRQRAIALQLVMEYANKNFPEPTLAQFNLDSKEPGYISPANPGYNAANTKYQTAIRNWTQRVMTETLHVAMGMNAASALFGDLLPGSALISSPTRDNWLKFSEDWWKAHTSGADWTYAKDFFLGDHPTTLPYAISPGEFLGKTVPPNMSLTEQYASGLKSTMPITDYLPFIAAMQSRWLYYQQSYRETRGSGQTGPQIIQNWAQHSLSLQNRDLEWQQYQASNPEAAGIITRHDARMYSANPDWQRQTTQQELLKQTLLGFQAFSNLFTGVGGMPTSEYQSALTTLKTALAQSYKSYQGTPDAVGQELNTYFKTVISPYMDAAGPIWNQIATAKASGLPTDSLYQQLTQILQQFSDPKILTIGGQVYPTPDAFFFYAKQPIARQIAIMHWTAEPISFLTPFQRDTVGYKSFTGEDDMWQKITQQNIQTNQLLTGIPTSSSQYDAIKTWGKNMDLVIAQGYGTDGLTAYQLSTAAPYDRLRSLNTFKDPVMQQAYQMADIVNARLQQLGLSPLGESSAQTQGLKDWFYSWVASQTDETFKRDLDQLSAAMTSGPDGTHPLGAPLLDAVFFGQFQPTFITTASAQIAAGG